MGGGGYMLGSWNMDCGKRPVLGPDIEEQTDNFLIFTTVTNFGGSVEIEIPSSR
jgi:hypothetical protein